MTDGYLKTVNFPEEILEAAKGMVTLKGIVEEQVKNEDGHPAVMKFTDENGNTEAVYACPINDKYKLYHLKNEDELTILGKSLKVLDALPCVPIRKKPTKSISMDYLASYKGQIEWARWFVFDIPESSKVVEERVKELKALLSKASTDEEKIMALFGVDYKDKGQADAFKTDASDFGWDLMAVTLGDYFGETYLEQDDYERAIVKYLGKEPEEDKLDMLLCDFWEFKRDVYASYLTYELHKTENYKALEGISPEPLKIEGMDADELEACKRKALEDYLFIYGKHKYAFTISERRIADFIKAPHDVVTETVMGIC